MKATRYILFLLIGCCMMACMQKPNKRKTNGQPFKIAVLHSYDERESGYTEYNTALAQSFADLGLDVDLVHYYLELNAGYSLDYNNIPAVADSLKANDFDLAITEGTLACYKTISYLTKHNQTSLPIVAGGVTVQVWDSLKVYPNLYVWIDELDYPRLVRLATSFQKTNIVRIELDHNFLDEQQRIDLKNSINRPPFYDDVDLGSLEAMELNNPQYKDSMVVMVVSAEEPNTNVAGALEGKNDTLTLQSLMSYASDLPTVVVKKDLFSNVLEGATKIPQFTALPYNFADDSRRYLAGFFIPFTTQARDVVSTASKLLQNQEINHQWQGRHIRQAFMDYNAFSSYPNLKYEEYVNLYNILNAPFHVAHPILSKAIQFSLLTALFLVLVVLVFLFFKYKKKKVKNLHTHLLEVDMDIMEQDCMVFLYEPGVSAKFSTIVSNDGKVWSHIVAQKDLPQMFHPESIMTFEHFSELCRKPGFYSEYGQLTFNEGQDFHWWKLRFVTQEVRNKKNVVSHLVTGIIINADAWYKKQQEIQKAQEKTAETKLRDDFIRTLNHEIRTPLNSVLGFSELITVDNMTLTAEEKDEYCRTIKYSVNRLNSLVSDILQFSRMESGRMRFEPMEIPINSFMDTVVTEAKTYVESKWLIDDEGVDKTGKMNLEYIPGWGDYSIRADINHLKQVYNHLISNAVKFSDSGTIHTGWYFDLQTQHIAIFVEDNGIGIPESEQENIFRFFYKANQQNRGVGLGLCISNSLIERMGGKLRVYSCVGKGSRFVILMPIV